MSGSVTFVGAGPGSPDLLTVRGVRAIAEADLVIWGARLLMEEAVTEHTRPGAELMPWPPATMADIHAAYDRAARDGLAVARLFAGDPSIFGKVREELGEARARGLRCAVVPGVSSLGAAAAALGRELTSAPGPSAPLLLASAPPDAPLDTPGLAAFAAAGASLAVFMAAGRGREIREALLQAGFSPDTPCVIARRISWPDEAIAECSLDDLDAHVPGADEGRQSLVLVGERLR